MRFRWTILACCCFFLTAQAQFHLTDSSFGIHGQSSFGLGSHARILHDVWVQDDDKIVCAGEFQSTSLNSHPFLARLLPSGQLDPGFGSGGMVVDSTAAVFAGAFAMALQSDGKIVVGGWGKDCHPVWNCTTVFTLLRYNTNGTRDTTFGTNGMVQTYPSDGSGNIFDLGILPDDRIVAVGRFGASGTGSMDINLARYMPDGDLDSSFGSQGLVFWAVGNGDDFARAVEIDANGKLVVAGYTTQNGEREALLARFHPNGTVDSSFGGGDGWVTVPLSGSEDEFMALDRLPDGGYFATGQSDPANANYLQLDAWFDSNGALDARFANGQGFQVGHLWNVPYAATSGRGCLAMQDGKVVVGGYFVPSSVNAFLMRYDLQGNRDFSFHPSGVDTLAPNSHYVQFLGLAAAPSGHLVAVGYKQPALSTNFEYWVVRFFNPGMMASLPKPIESEPNLMVYPNPGNGHFDIVSHGSFQPLKAKILSSNGDLVQSFELFSNSFEVDLTESAPGLYWIAVEMERGKWKFSPLVLTGR